MQIVEFHAFGTATFLYASAAGFHCERIKGFTSSEYRN